MGTISVAGIIVLCSWMVCMPISIAGEFMNTLEYITYCAS